MAAGESGKQASPVGKQVPQQAADQYSECVICMNEEAAYAIIPCGHLCLCQVPILLFLLSWLTYTYAFRFAFITFWNINVCMYVMYKDCKCMYVCIDSRLFIYMNVCFPLVLFVILCMYVYMYVSVYLSMYVCMSHHSYSRRW